MPNQSGFTVVEYILILAFTAVASTALYKTLHDSVSRGVLFLGSELEKDLKTGREIISTYKEYR